MVVIVWLLLQVSKQPGFLNCYVPLDGELVKEVFSGETIGTTKQSAIPSFGMVLLIRQLQQLAMVYLLGSCCPSPFNSPAAIIT